MQVKVLPKCVFILIFAALALVWKPARATTIDPLTLEQLVSGASFVGVIECETAGGIVAEYRVVESWKGAPVGTRFHLRISVNYWEPQFPIALVGQRSVVTAFADEPPSRVMSTTSGGGVPLWWREIPYQYSLPLFQGMAGVPKTPRKSYYAFGQEYSSFAELRVKVQKLLSLSPEAFEVTLMRSLFSKYSRWREKPKKETSQILSLKKRIETATTPAQIANALLTLKWKDREAVIAPALSQGGGAATLKFLATLTDKQWPFEKSERERIISSIQSRLDLQQARENIPASKPDLSRGDKAEENIPVPDEKTLAAMRRVLNGKETPDDSRLGDFQHAFVTLTKHDPAIVAGYLRDWKNADESWRDSGQGYVLGSYFAWKCGEEREVHLRALLKAQDPYIRVAGAVYLCFENREEGVAALKTLVNLPGDPGAWAALNLARRGDKTALPRALRVLETAGNGSMTGVPHRNLQKRVLVLLSNSAKKSAVPQPLNNYDLAGEDANAVAKKQYQHLLQWWRKNQAQMTLSDPWLPLLEKQKVD